MKFGAVGWVGSRRSWKSQVMKGWTCLTKSVNLTLHGVQLLKYFNQGGTLICEPDIV